MGQDKHRILIVGCGLAGATVARQLADRGYSIDIIDARSHVAGNAYDYQDKRGFRFINMDLICIIQVMHMSTSGFLNLPTGLFISMKSKQS